MKTQLRALTLGLLGLVLGACTQDNPLFCDENKGCSQNNEGNRTFCDIDRAFPDTKLENECVVPPSGDACNRAQPCESAARPYCSDPSAGTCVECTAPSHCEVTEECDPSGTCVVFSCTPGAAGDAACEASDATTPYCGGDACVACVESGHCPSVDASVCDPEESTCRGCEAHSECESGACVIASGECAADTEIVYVAPTGSVAGGCGSRLNPCRTIAIGIAEVGGNRNKVVVAAGEYSEAVVIDGKSLSLIGDGEVLIKPVLGTDESVLSVSGGGVVEIFAVELSGSLGLAGSDALVCSGAATTLRLDGVAVEESRDVGVLSSNCTLEIEDSSISDNVGIALSVSGGSLGLHGSRVFANRDGGIEVTGASYEIVNNFVVDNGADGALGSTIGGVSLSGTQSFSERFDFNTLAGNAVDNGALQGSAFTCSASALSATSNIIVSVGQGGGLGLIAGSCAFSHSLIEGASPFAGTGNIVGDPLFVDVGTADYHLQSSSPCIDKADPDATLGIDIDGESRPQGAGHDMGADEAG